MAVRQSVNQLACQSPAPKERRRKAKLELAIGLTKKLDFKHCMSMGYKPNKSIDRTFPVVEFMAKEVHVNRR